MQIIPAINCPDFETLSRQLDEASRFLPEGSFVHIDIVDGMFSKNITWNNPAELLNLKSFYPSLNFEIHLMIENPDEFVEIWFINGASRVIVHLEAVNNPDYILDIASRYNGEAILSVIPSTPADLLLPHVGSFSSFQILAVNPGFAGQEFNLESLEKIKFLRNVAPSAKIEVDGGINPETARLAKIAGADYAVSASYIFNNINPSEAYEELNGAAA